MKNLSAKFHLSLGLTSIVLTLLLGATMLGLIPDRKQHVMDSRISLSESIASSSTLFLSNKDYPSILSNLEFVTERNESVVASTIQRPQDEKPLIIGDESVVDPNLNTDASSESIITLPIMQGETAWGEIVLYFQDIQGTSLLEKIRNSPFTLIVFSSLLGFALFYFYLGRMLKALNPSQAVPGRVRSALDTLAEALLVIDGKSNVVLANKAFQSITGESAESVLGKKAAEFNWHINDKHPDEEQTENDGKFPWAEALATGESIRGAGLWLKAENNNWHKFQVNCSPIMSGKKASGVLVSLDDVTELEEKEKQLRFAVDAAQDANRAKSDFLSNMSHEIRTPMTAILGFTEVLKRGTGDTDSWEKHLNTISSSGKHLLELINDVLDLSKVESGALEVEQIDCRPHMVAHEVCKVLRVRAEDKKIALNIKIPEALPEVIQTDAGRLRQIMTNLIGNAIKFTETGGVDLILRKEVNNGKLQLAVDIKDTGIGMNDKQQEAVFKPFVQADASITRRFGGTGLGLAISKDLAKALGGDIVLSSEPGVGTTFTAIIDIITEDGVETLSPDDLFAQMEIAESIEMAHWEFPSDVKLLVIDDAAENRELLTLVLNDMGLETDTAEDGKIGSDMAVASHYDVILSDIQMPVMDGYQAVAAMRGAGLEQPIIALTANAMKGYEEKILKAGFSHYMTKPIDIDALSKLLAELLGGKQIDAPANKTAGPPANALNAEQPSTINTVAANSDSDNTPIYSQLGGSEKLAPVVEKFITRVREQHNKMTEAAKQKDFTELSALGHWLKGSGGTVGFKQLSKPAKNLETLAKAEDLEGCQQELVHILGIIERLRPGAPIAGSVDHVQTTESTDSDSDVGSVDVIESSILETNPALRPVVMKFLPRLKSQIEEMDKAIKNNDFEELTALAHWLKGSGGTVGFKVFSKPAATMETAAKNGDMDAVKKNLVTIKGYASKVVVAGNDGDITEYRKLA